MKKNLIYLIVCNRCFTHYVGQRVDKFRYQWKNYRGNTRKFKRGERCMQRHLYKDFNLPGPSGFLKNASASLIVKTNAKNTIKGEDYWIHTLKTNALMGLNVEDSKIVCRHKILCFISLIMFMDELYLNNVFGHEF